jgi:hypothetical protein
MFRKEIIEAKATIPKTVLGSSPDEGGFCSFNYSSLRIMFVLRHSVSDLWQAWGQDVRKC